MIKNLSWMFLTVSLACFSSLALEYDGVQVSAPSAKQQITQTIIKDYVQHRVIYSLLKTTGEVFDTAVKRQHIQLFPQIVYSAAQKAASECLNQPDLTKMVHDAYDHGVEAADEQRDLKAGPAAIQNKINDTVAADISRIVYEPYYRLIVEQYIQQAMIQQRTIMMQKAVEAELQKLVVQQKVMEQALQQQYLKTIQGIH